MRYDEASEQFGGVSLEQRGQGATAEEIQDAATELGVVLPESYRAFLREFGWGAVGHSEIYGLGADVPAHLNLVHVTLEGRRDFAPLTPQHLIPILNDGGGNLHCLDTARMVNGECPVVLWDHDESEEQVPYELADSFPRWLSERIDAVRLARQ